MSRKILVVLVAVAVAAGMIVPLSGHGFSLFGQHQKVRAVDGKVLLPVEDIDDGKAHFFTLATEATEIKFFVIKSQDGVIRAAFDACDVCFPEKKGYSQDGDYMVCIKCGRRFHSAQINMVKGGCNPAPLTRDLVGDQLVIKVEDLLPGARFF